MTASVIGGQASINSSEFYPAEIRFNADVQYIRSETAVKPDPEWEHTDSNEHFHAFAEDGKTPTLTEYSVHVECDGSCGGVCGGEGYDETHWQCVICEEEVEPRFVPDYEAREAGIPVVTSKRTTVTVRGYGPLPQLGQQSNGDGTFTVANGPSRVAVRVRTGGGELIGTGYAAARLTYRIGGTEWTVTVDGAPLLPRLKQPDREQVP